MSSITHRILLLILCFTYIVPVFAQTGAEPEEDDCEAKHEAFREAKAILQQMKKDFECACAMEESAGREQLSMLGNVASLCASQWTDMIKGIAGNLSPVSNRKMRQLGKGLTREMQKLEKAGTQKEMRNIGIKGVFDAVFGLKNAKHGEDVVSKLIEKIDEDERKFKERDEFCKNVIVTAKQERESLENAWPESKKKFNEAMDAILETCNPEFYSVFEDPNWDKCPSPINGIGGGWEGKIRCNKAVKPITNISQWKAVSPECK